MFVLYYVVKIESDSLTYHLFAWHFLAWVSISDAGEFGADKAAVLQLDGGVYLGDETAEGVQHRQVLQRRDAACHRRVGYAHEAVYSPPVARGDAGRDVGPLRDGGEYLAPSEDQHGEVVARNMAQQQEKDRIAREDEEPARQHFAGIAHFRKKPRDNGGADNHRNAV